MDYEPGNLSGEQSAMGTYHSRGLVRGTGLVGLLVLVGGVLAAVLGSDTTASMGAIVAVLGGLAAGLAALNELIARRHPAPETAPDAHAGPREAGW